MRVLRFLPFVAIAAVAISACNSARNPVTGDDDDDVVSATPTPDPSAPTYYEDVLPVVMANCQACHTAGGIAAAIDEFSVAQQRSALMKDYTAHRPLPTDPAAGPFTGNALMPPWPPEEGCNQELRGTRLTTAAEKDIFRRWHDAGAPEGNPANAPTPLPAATPLPPPNLTLDGGADYAFGGPGDPQNRYQCFRLKLNLTQAADLVRAKTVPGNKSIVHHVILYREPNGSTQPAGDMGTCTGIPSGGEHLVGWVPGAEPLEFPADTGMRLQPTDAIAMQVHYYNTGTEQLDRTTTELWFSPTPVTKLASVVWMGKALFNIPPNTSSYSASGTCTVPSGGNPVLLGISPHMHTRGTKIGATLKRSGQADACLIDVDKWDFGWQGTYMYSTPKPLNPGDQIVSKCTWANPTDSSIGFGEGTEDEMCFNFVYIVDWNGPAYCGVI